MADAGIAPGLAGLTVLLRASFRRRGRLSVTLRTSVIPAGLARTTRRRAPNLDELVLGALRRFRSFQSDPLAGRGVRVGRGIDSYQDQS